MPISFLKIKSTGTMAVIAVLIMCVGIVMTIIPSNKTKIEYVQEGNNLYGYTENIEERLENIIEKIEGVGKTSVMVTFESSFESVFASNAKLVESGISINGNESKNTEKELVLTQGKSGSEEPVLLKELCPRVKGVFIVCEGGDNKNTVEKIKQAVSALFAIPETKICVTAGGTT